jgi:hypothetical protein
MFSLRGHKVPLVKHINHPYFFNLLNLKTMKKNAFFLLLTALSFAACNPTPMPVGPTKIEGRLMDRGTNIPIPNTAVKLVEITGDLFGTPKRDIIQSVTTDDKGQYAFTYQWEDLLKTYELDARPKDLDKYYDLPKVVGEFKQGQTNKVDCFLDPYSWVKYRIRNTNPFNDRDTIRCYAGMFTGRNVDQTVIYKDLKLWDKPDSIGWSVVKNNILTRYVKPVSYVPKDTVLFEINY